jgi:class 3 adenylate cyclase
MAVGLPRADPESRQFSPADVAGFSEFDAAAKLFGERALLDFMRVVGSSLARIAEAGVSLFLVNIEGPIVEHGGNEVALARANLEVIRAFDTVPIFMNTLLRSHLEVAIRRMRNAREGRSVDLVRMAVGFIDLVGFTSVSRKLTARELAGLVTEFEGRAHDVIVAAGGRLVKLIGDEVMFVATDAAAACDIALTLLERFIGDAAITPRGGVAFGPLLMRGGDYYGPIVNLASRIAELAVPHEILVTQDLVASAGHERFAFEPAGRRLLKGFDEPVTLFAAQRKTGQKKGQATF